MNVMTTTNYYNNADPTSRSNARSDKILNLGNANPRAVDLPFPSSDLPLMGDSSFYPTSFAAAPQYNQDLPTTGPVENLFEGLPEESVETNLDDTPAMRLSVAQPQAVIGKNKHNKSTIKKGRYTLEQKRILDQAFNSDPNPNASRISTLAQQTGLAELQIANWFSRQRKSGDVSKNSSESEEENSVSSAGGNKSPRRDEERPVRNAETILAPYIEETGGITRIEHMAKCHQLMQEEKNLEQRLFIVTVLSESSVNSLRYFAFDLNGLAILDEWLQQYRKDNKVLLIKRILKVLTKTPVTVDVLTKVSIGKTVNSIVKKATDEVVRELGRSLVEKWKQLVQTSDQTSRPTTPEQSRKGTPSPPPTRATPGGLRISNEGRPPATAVRPMPLRSNGLEASDDFEAQLGGTETQPKRKTSLGFDHLRRQKHGIQLKDDLQNEDDRLKRLGNKPTASKPISIDDIKRKKVQKQIMQEASLGSLDPIDASHFEPHSSPEPSSDEGDEPAAKRRKISSDREEVTQARPNSPVLHDSDIEMLNESYTSGPQSHYNSHSTEDDEMGVDLEKVPDDDALPDIVLPSTPPLQGTPILDEGSMTPRLMDSEDQETPPSRKRKRKGLNVRWAPDEQLTMIRLFDKEEASVHAQRDFKAAARAEHSNEKLSNDTIKKQEEDEWKERAQNMVPTIIWHSPIPIDFSKSVVKIASPDSDEAKRLAQREQEQMMVSYWNDAQIPPNPKEAPAEDNVGQVPEPIVINPNVPITSDSLTQLLSSLQNKVGGAAPVNRPAQVPMPGQMPLQMPQQQQFNATPLLFNNNTMPGQMPQQQFMQQQLMPQQGIQNLLLSLAGQGLLNPILAVAQQTQQQMVSNQLLNLAAQPHNPNQGQHQQQSYSHHQGGRGGYNNNNNQHYNQNNNQYGQGQNYQGQGQGRGGYNDRGGYNQNYQGRGGGYSDRGGYNDRGRGGQRGGGQSRGGGPSRGHYRGGGRGNYNNH